MKFMEKNMGGDNMVKIKDLLDAREIDMLQFYQQAVLQLDIEDNEGINMYQNLIKEMIENAKERYYKENPSITPIKKEGIAKELTNKNTMKVRDLLTEEEAEEVDFLKWRLSKSIFPWTRNRNQRKIETILDEAKRRNGY